MEVEHVTVYDFLFKHLNAEERVALAAVRTEAEKEVPGLPFKIVDSTDYILNQMFATKEAVAAIEESTSKVATLPQIIHELLIRSFVWELSPQGTMFWTAVSDKYRVKAGLKRQFYIN